MSERRLMSRGAKRIFDTQNEGLLRSVTYPFPLSRRCRSEMTNGLFIYQLFQIFHTHIDPIGNVLGLQVVWFAPGQLFGNEGQ